MTAVDDEDVDNYRAADSKDGKPLAWDCPLVSRSIDRLGKEAQIHLRTVHGPLLQSALPNEGCPSLNYLFEIEERRCDVPTNVGMATNQNEENKGGTCKA